MDFDIVHMENFYVVKMNQMLVSLTGGSEGFKVDGRSGSGGG